jgi:superoxide dismutase
VFASLEPFIDAATMEIHHGKHHKVYVDNLNSALAKLEYKNETIEQMLHHISKYNLPLRNNDNHSLFWKLLAPSKKHHQQIKLKRPFKRSSLQWKILKSSLLKRALEDLEADGHGLLKHLITNCKSFPNPIKTIH